MNSVYYMSWLFEVFEIFPKKSKSIINVLQSYVKSLRRLKARFELDNEIFIWMFSVNDF